MSAARALMPIVIGVLFGWLVADKWTHSRRATLANKASHIMNAVFIEHIVISTDGLPPGCADESGDIQEKVISTEDGGITCRPFALVKCKDAGENAVSCDFKIGGPLVPGDRWPE